MEVKQVMIRDKYTIITGAAGFLGTHHCRAVLQMSRSLIMVDNNQKLLKKTKTILENEFKKNNPKIITANIDITKEKQVKKLKYFLKKKKLLIDSIINNAAIDAIPKKTKKNTYLSVKQIQKEINVSLIGSYLIIENFKELLFKNKNSSVINIGSDLSIIAPNQDIYKQTFLNYKKPISYSLIKHGIVGMTKYYASTYAKKNTRFNMVSPGPIERNQRGLFKKKLKNVIPMNRLGSTNDLYGVIKFLLGKSSTFITGQNILVDGGRTII